jgi:hypothetical protein
VKDVSSDDSFTGVVVFMVSSTVDKISGMSVNAETATAVDESVVNETAVVDGSSVGSVVGDGKVVDRTVVVSSRVESSHLADCCDGVVRVVSVAGKSE